MYKDKGQVSGVEGSLFAHKVWKNGSTEIEWENLRLVMKYVNCRIRGIARVVDSECIDPNSSAPSMKDMLNEQC